MQPQTPQKASPCLAPSELQNLDPYGQETSASVSLHVTMPGYSILTHKYTKIKKRFVQNIGTHILLYREKKIFVLLDSSVTSYKTNGKGCEQSSLPVCGSSSWGKQRPPVAKEAAEGVSAAPALPSTVKPRVVRKLCLGQLHGPTLTSVQLWHEEERFPKQTNLWELVGPCPSPAA